MSVAFRPVVLALSSFLIFSLSGQVVFSRRIYNQQGPSYQQIWTWNPSTAVLKAITQSQRNHYLPACRSGKVTFVSPEKYEDNSKLWIFDPATGEERVIGPAPAPPNHEVPKNGCVKSGALEACIRNEEDLFLSHDGKPIGHFHIQANECLDEHGGTRGPCATPILSLDWSPDGKWLLVGELGLDTSSTAPQFDYYVVEPASVKLQKAASAEQYSMIWLPGRDDLLYTTSRDMASLAGARKARHVWVQQLMLFNPTTGKHTPITSGVTSNLDAALCGQ
jgi:hypothetical protein